MKTLDLFKLLGAVLVIAMGVHAQDITISNAAELAAFRDAVNGGNYYQGKTVMLLNDIDLNGNEDNQWIPIGDFKGTFDGNNKVIAGIYINNSSNYQGLFGRIAGATIKNLGIDVNIKGGEYVGGLVGAMNASTVSNSYATGSVSGGSPIGGLVGISTGADDIIENSYATVSVEGGFAGGLVGQNGGTIKNSYATGNVKGGLSSGGLVGSNYKGTVSNSYATGNIEGTGFAGGLVGNTSDASSTIENSYAIGNVKSSAASDDFVGGLVGSNPGTVSNSYAIGNRLVGYESSGTIVNSDTKTAEEMRQQSTFIGWDFTAIWAINTNANCGHPYLRTVDGVLLSGDCKTTPILLPQIANSNIRAQVAANAIMLENLPSNAKIEVYNLQGKQIHSTHSENSQILRITVQTKGMYIVKISFGSEKQILRVPIR